MGILQELVDKGIKQIYIQHAKNSGAREDWVAKLEDMPSQVVHLAVSVCFGDPEIKEK